MSTGTNPTDIRPIAHKVIDSLPAEATWEDVLYRIYVRQRIETGIADADAGNLVDHDEICKQFGIEPCE